MVELLSTEAVLVVEEELVILSLKDRKRGQKTNSNYLLCLIVGQFVLQEDEGCANSLGVCNGRHLLSPRELSEDALDEYPLDAEIDISSNEVLFNMLGEDCAFEESTLLKEEEGRVI